MPAKAVYYFYVKNGRETLLFKCGGMSFMKLGIVGLPNVGKSTLFNAITQAGAESANYPFCTMSACSR